MRDCAPFASVFEPAEPLFLTQLDRLESRSLEFVQSGWNTLPLIGGEGAFFWAPREGPWSARLLSARFMSSEDESPRDRGRMLSNCISRLLLAIATFWIALAPRAEAVWSKKGPPLQNSASFGGYVANTYFDPSSNTKDAYFRNP
jgi:hypothetical protein